MASTRTLTATDPLTGQTVIRRTARTYHGAIVWSGTNGALHVYGWAGRPDLAEATLKKVHRAGVTDARLAPVTADPWAVVEPVAPAPVERVTVAPAAAAPVERVTVAEPVAPAAPEPVATVAQARPRSLAPLAADLGQSLGLGRGGTIRPARRPVTLPGEEGRPPAPVAQGPGPELPALAAPAPTGDAWAGQPWDPGTPEARARVALQGERVATLWPVALALRGAGVTLPGSWATDGPVMAGEWTYDRALAALPLGAIAAAAAALAALPPVTRAQARALELCRGQFPTG